MAHAEAHPAAHAEQQQHPIKLYLLVWGLLFVLSAFSYLVDYFGLQGYLRWSLILIFMMLKAGLIVAVFMHMAWERLALTYAILLPPLLVLVFVALMVSESNYVLFTPPCLLRHRALTAGRERKSERFLAAAAIWTVRRRVKSLILTCVTQNSSPWSSRFVETHLRINSPKTIYLVRNDRRLNPLCAPSGTRTIDTIRVPKCLRKKASTG
ncbi:cytochrome c oxidase subunit IV [Sinorhizobium fredii]